MPKNPFQRPQPINHKHNVPRHGLQQPVPPLKAAKAKAQAPQPALPPLDKLLGSAQR